MFSTAPAGHQIPPLPAVRQVFAGVGSENKVCIHVSTNTSLVVSGSEQQLLIIWGVSQCCDSRSSLFSHHSLQHLLFEWLQFNGYTDRHVGVMTAGVVCRLL